MKGEVRSERIREIPERQAAAHLKESKLERRKFGCSAGFGVPSVA
jgi:hypothetical protein